MGCKHTGQTGFPSLIVTLPTYRSIMSPVLTGVSYLARQIDARSQTLVKSDLKFRGARLRIGQLYHLRRRTAHVWQNFRQAYATLCHLRRSANRFMDFLVPRDHTLESRHGFRRRGTHGSCQGPEILTFEVRRILRRHWVPAFGGDSEAGARAAHHLAMDALVTTCSGGGSDRGSHSRDCGAGGIHPASPDRPAKRR